MKKIKIQLESDACPLPLQLKRISQAPKRSLKDVLYEKLGFRYKFFEFGTDSQMMGSKKTTAEQRVSGVENTDARKKYFDMLD